MSVDAVMLRIAELQQGLQPSTPASDGAAAPASTFSALLAGQAGTTASAALLPTASAAGQTAGQRALAAAQGEVGVAEQPPGSNDAPRIAQYRQATAGSGIGPWCAYFVSWAAQQAGTPLGEAGQGFGSVGAVASWAQRTGRWNPAGSGTPPQAGDLIVWGGHHIGIVESVDPDGSIHTIEGNSSNAVTRRTHGADGDGASGFVRLG
ncbi:CHAP domain-containing protein [Baekduia soli]|uniref:CHAP domain-containing protein n=1 Tax=Baekduia soli TaxID=496014 RepID=A0A5B8U1H0_9ACTN|nr:CHAP domain-containing protein [Baekduia soli]QEC46869.1 CHAP domain-containing protein [Baekduia soli]